MMNTDTIKVGTSTIAPSVFFDNLPNASTDFTVDYTDFTDISTDNTEQD